MSLNKLKNWLGRDKRITQAAMAKNNIDRVSIIKAVKR